MSVASASLASVTSVGLQVCPADPAVAATVSGTGVFAIMAKLPQVIVVSPIVQSVPS